MGFYYISIFSIIPLGIAYILLALVYWGVVRGTRAMPARKTILSIVGVIFLILPIGEELWIAWNFGQACKEAGTFITRKVQVEGFYDDTTGWGARQLSESKYRFMESKDVLHGTLLRVEPADDASRDQALAWYVGKNPGKERSKDLFVVHQINDKERVVVSPNGVDAWRVVTIDRPTAKYWFGLDRGIKVAHKVGKEQSAVTDMQANEVIARYVRVHRTAPWYFIGLVGSPILGCDSPDGGPHSKHSALIYREVLLPIGSTSGVSK